MRSCRRQRLFEVEGRRDRIERRLMLCMRNRDDQPSGVRPPAQPKERAAPPLNGEQFLDELPVESFVQIDPQAPSRTLDQASADAGAVSLVLQAQARLVKSTARRDRQVHPKQATTQPLTYQRALE